VTLHDNLVLGSEERAGTIAFQLDSQLSNYAAPFDDFVARQTASITSLEWQGYYCNVQFTGSDIPTPVATSFIVHIAQNEDGQQRPPYAAFNSTATGSSYIQAIPAAAVRLQLEFTRLDAGCGARNGGDPAAYYRQSAELPAPYRVTAGQRYWISIYAVLPPVRVAWHWRNGGVDNGFSIFCLNCGCR
jgi:hypothetical protein